MLQGEGRVWHRCLTIQRAAAKLFAKAASELVSMVCRRVWRLSASLHRYRARTRLWCNGDRMAKRRRVTAKPLLPNVGTLGAKPFRLPVYPRRERLVCRVSRAPGRDDPASWAGEYIPSLFRRSVIY